MACGYPMTTRGTEHQGNAVADDENLDKRTTELEIKISHIEHSVAELSDVLYRQQALLDALERRFDELRQQVEAASDGGSAEPQSDEKPPHY